MRSDNEPCGLVTNGRRGNAVAVAWQPMRDRKNRSGWCVGAEVKNFVKDVMETQSCEHGFICIGQNVDILDLRRQPVG